nr:MAG TPA: hypothetical protein [Caudoviricetes sp.]
MDDNTAVVLNNLILVVFLLGALYISKRNKK